MTTRKVGSDTYNLAYDEENRLTSVSGAASATFVYDGDGNRVKATFGSATTVYPSALDLRSALRAGCGELL
jgi:YD repeat-containing protein